VRPPVAESIWAARAARARELAAARPEARDALEFLARLTAVQQSLAAQYRSADAAILPYLEWLAANAPPPIARAAAALTTMPTDPDAEGAETFIVESLFQVFPPDPCSFCAAPVVSLLREAGHGSRRSQVCGVCLAESSAPRLGCPSCGEQRVEALPIFRSDATEPARIDACDTCRAYTKTIDLTRNASACPIADDVASISLDLWVREQGYQRARPNLLRL
jgi:formate dehydrogenase maturation protein FdhE